MNKNQEQRMAFIDFWANYVRTHDDKEWSRLQNTVINQTPGMTAEQFLKMKGHQAKPVK
ncbi:MAG: hypothetical protein AABX14_03345 [Candidatus Aenigmatarchaeota archaeon]